VSDRSGRSSSIFSERLDATELMDDFSIDDDRLTDALEELRLINRWLGGHYLSTRCLARIAAERSLTTMRVLDLACGAADYSEAFIRWGAGAGVQVDVTAVDANEATCAYASASLHERLEPALRPRARVVHADALATGFDTEAYDVVHTALFLHHLDNEEIVRLLGEMWRMARVSVIANDLHRHPLAYHALRAMGWLLPVSDMFRHDGPVSVLRGFTRRELEGYASTAGLTATVSWFPGFRWLMRIDR
jgi:ubiquinone/menaquinone biosynthesis C-methylase UbiE